MLCSAIAADQAGIEHDKTALEAKFGQLRPEVLDTLRKYTYINHAFVVYSLPLSKKWP
jgi:nuclear pore complex protein Nup133